MRWTTKARLQRVCARAPRGDRLYVALQRRFGTLDGSPESRIPHFAHMLEWLRDAGRSPVGMRCVELGTGHKATLPLLFALSGAASVRTVDLNRRLDADLMARVIENLLAQEDELLRTIGEFVPEPVVRERFATLRSHRGNPGAMGAIGVEYLAPADASRLPLADASVDLHFSTTVLEHIAEPDLGAILREESRTLSPEGVALHFVDLSDHFAHQDSSITKGNFLRYSNAEWDKLAGNEFGYCNRLRIDDFERIFATCGLATLRAETQVDERTAAALRSGVLRPHPGVGNGSVDRLASDTLRVLLTPPGS